MALYKHVANKEELLDGVADVVILEIDPALETADWRTAVRERVLSARQVLLRHTWGRAVIETRVGASPVVLDHIDSLVAMFRQVAARWLHVAGIAGAGAAHDADSVVGGGCDDQYEFEFALDLMLDGFERLRQQDWTPQR